MKGMHPMLNKIDTSHYDKCRTMMKTHKNHHRLRMILLCIMMLINSYVNIILFPVQHNLPYMYGFLLGMVLFLYCAGILATALFAVPDKIKLCILTEVLLILGIFIHAVHPVTGIVMLFIFATQIPECCQAVWLRKQEGWPHFNERFTEQMQSFGKEYQPDYPTDHVENAEMPDIPEIPSDFPEIK